MQKSSCESIILALADYREADRLVTFFTLEHGKLRGIARNARKSRKRFGGALELFARLKLQVVVQEGLCPISEADIVTVFPRIRQDLAKIGHAGYACELTDRLLPEGMRNPRMFRLLVSYLEQLDQTMVSSSDRRFFEVNLLNILGYRLPIDHCAGCGAPLEVALGESFARRGAGLLCGACGRGGRTIGAPTVALLRRAMQTGRFGVLSFLSEELVEAGELVDAAIAAHLNRPLKSLAFLQEMTRLEGAPATPAPAIMLDTGSEKR